MLTVLGFYKRKQGMSREEFSHHWRHVHGPLIMALSRYFRRYVQHHLSPNTFFQGVTPIEYDGFSELWFDDVETRRKFISDPHFLEQVLPDEPKFIIVSATRTQMVDNPIVMMPGNNVV